MTEHTPMRRLPEKKIWQTQESLFEDLKKAYEELMTAHAHSKETGYEWHATDFIVATARVRTLAEEILRWELL